ncbi:MAG: flagellar motor switch protein FliN [Clostridium sp.]
MGVNSFNEMEKDALGEMMNISLGASATAMSTLLGAAVNITTPVVRILNRSQFEFKKLEPAVGVEIAYVEGLEGSNIMMFSRNDVRIIVSTLMGQDIPEEQFELDEINRSAICEVMNQMMGSSATAMSEFLKMTVNISTPVSFEIDDEKSFKEKYFPADEYMVVVGFTLEIVGKLTSEFLNIMPQSLAKRLLEPFADTLESAKKAQQAMEMETKEQNEGLADPAADEQQPEPEAPYTVPVPPVLQPQPAAQTQQTSVQPQQIPAQPQQQPVQPDMASAPPYWNGMPQNGYMPPYGMQPAADPAFMQLLVQLQQSQTSMMEMMRTMEQKEKSKESRPKAENNIIRPSYSPQLEACDTGKDEEKANQEMLMRVPLEISVEIGRTKKLVKDILEFTQGSLVVLDKMAGEQADLYVNGQCIARGDIVVVEDNFGIRITEIVACDLNQESL